MYIIIFVVGGGVGGHGIKNTLISQVLTRMGGVDMERDSPHMTVDGIRLTTRYNRVARE